MSSKVNVLFDDILNEEEDELYKLKFITQVVDEITENALDTAEDHDAIPQSVHEETISDISFAEELSHGTISDSASASRSEESSVSSYVEPSYLTLHPPHVESSKDFLVELGQEHTCEQYENIDTYASIVVDKIINKAVAAASVDLVRGEIEQYMDVSKFEGEEEEEEEDETASSTTASSILEWPSVEAFTVEYGLNRIYEFMDTWDYEEDWLYCVDFVAIFSDDCSDYYKYEAKWSIPTQMYPIPQATASIHFTIERSRVKPRNCPVKVTYVYEGTSFVHSLESAFSEDRLFEIIDAKLKFFQRLTF